MDLSAFPYLQGNYAPIAEERDFDETQLRIEGPRPMPVSLCMCPTPTATVRKTAG